MPSATPSAPAATDSAGVALLAWAHFLNDGAANYLPGILPAVLVALGLPLAYAGAIMAALIVGQALQPVAGALADRFGPRPFVVLGLAGSTVGAACVGWAPGLGTLLVALGLIGLGNACFHPPAMAGVRAFAAGSGERPMSAFSVGGELGRGVWPLAASFVVAGLGLPAIGLLSIPGVATLPVLWRRAPRARRRVRAGAALAELRQAGAPLFWVVAYSSLRSVTIVAVTAFVPLLWQARGGHLVTGAAFISVMLVVGIVGNFGAAFLAARFGRRRLVVIASALACLLLAAFLGAHGIAMWLTMAGFGIAVFATLPLTILMGQDLLPRNHSLASGLALGFANAVGAVIVAILGLWAARWGAGGELWAGEIAALVALATAFFLPAAARGSEHRIVAAEI